MDEITIPVSKLQPGDEFWSTGGAFMWSARLAPPTVLSRVVRIDVQYMDGGRGTREWFGDPDITVRRPSS